MIQSAAPTLSADLTKVAGKAHGAAAKAAGAGSFSAILDGSDNADAGAEEASPAAAEQAALLGAAVAGGKAGKATGKILPDTPATLKKAKTETDTETDTDGADEVADETMPASIPFTLADILSLPAATEPRTTKQSSDAVADISGRLATPTLPEAALNNASSKGLVQSSASERALAVHQLLSQAATAIQTPVEGQQSVSGQDAAPVPAAVAATSSATTANDPALAAVKLAPVELVTEAAPATTAQLAARASSAPAVTPGIAQAVAGQNPTASTDKQDRVASAQPEAHEVTLRKSEKTDQLMATTSRPIAAAVLPQVLPTDAAPAQITTAAPAAPSAAAPVQGPQDFATLVSRLNEAREAADPQFVRTAINHAEFGQVSLEFRHKDNGLAVTMASNDPNFAGTVQAAAQASLANNSGDTGNEPRQQSQQYNPASQQQASAGTGSGNGNTQNQQARADQAGQAINRGQGTTSRSQDQEASAPRQGRDGTRRNGGVYA